ncbi:cation-translocating P-type ATPase [Poseidonocella sedimentorum]|uniref:Ca2+-transporting ATPase n=1 Tax=Poseidonocella sedimentorum TaxID=871652 RepID=A0A1I6DVG7_9RHOB|nr:cation-transporting P-type ATPase [Poseidonocella sedimentorum]SFR09453.1 Ca2+-transporting ATPase [Poseidonocella sedimentorum]
MTEHFHPGLSPEEVTAARAAHGDNALPKLPPQPWWRALLRQFESPLIVILGLAALAAGMLGEMVDAVVIGAVIVLNAVLGFAQEWRAERALAALTAMLVPTATVRRAGLARAVPATEIVPGDILLLAAGDRIAADGALVSAADCEVDESILTGESLPVRKLLGAEISAGTSVVSGRAEARVTATGPRTAFAEIARLTGGVDRRPTQLQIALGALARWLGLAAIAVGGGVALLGIMVGKDVFTMVLTAISLAVAMVPEGLPAVVTITLALGARAMVRKQALVRRMQAIETLGAASVICTDKTGTLTENKMTATRLWAAGLEAEVTDPEARAGLAPVLPRMAEVCRSCTHASRHRGLDGALIENGSPTELALLALAEGLDDAPRSGMLSERPFTSDRKRMSCLIETGAGPRLLTKGAPDVLLGLVSHIATAGGDVPLDAGWAAAAQAAHEQLAAGGMRVIALADRAAVDAADTAEERLTLLGFVGLIDPPRAEVAGAVARAGAAGIRVIMITGDGAITARAIAGALDIPADHVLTGAQLAEMPDDALAEALDRPVLFARTRPADKLRIVQALQARGAVVAMTGDGVNDAPALKRADIGVAMGQRGTDVAQEAADVILLDDNFTTIVNAIDEGRRQFANIQKFVRYLLSSNAGEVLALVANLIIGGPLIFLATQILWMNLVTDGVTAVALGLEKAEPGQMRAPPRQPRAPILGLSGFAMILAFGLYTGGASLFLFYSVLPVDPALANTLAFTAMVVFEKMSVFAFRSLRTPVTRIGWASNRLLIGALVITLGLQVSVVYIPVMQQILHTVPLGLIHWLWIAGLSLPLVALPELAKVVTFARQQRRDLRFQPDARIHGE